VAALPALSRVAGVVLSPGFIADETRNRGKAVKFAGIKAD
jgi:hypothetical protein